MSINKVILLGRVGQDPEIKYLDGGICFARFSMATSDRAFTNSRGEQVPERTEWHNIVAWRGIAQVIEKYVVKGTQLFVEGKLQSRSWDDATTGQKRYITEILIENMELLQGRKENAAGQSSIPTPPPPPASQSWGQQRAAAETPADKPAATTENPPFANEPDDLPF